MTEQEKKELFAVLAFQLNDLIDVATRTYDLAVILIRNTESAFVTRHFPDLCKMLGKVHSQGKTVQEQTEKIIANLGQSE